MKKLRRYTFYFLLGLALLLGAAVAGVWLGQDRIIGLFVQEANHYLRTPVQVGKMEVSLLDQFPRVSITLHEVRVSGSLPQDTVPLARVRRLYCAFDAWDIWRGHYRIRAITLTDGRVYVGHDGQGRPNYDVIRYDTTATASDKPLAFGLENVHLERIHTTYNDQLRQQRYTVRVEDMQAELDVNDMLVDVTARGDTHVEALQLGSDVYFRDKALAVNTRLRVDRAARLVSIQPSELKIGRAAYGVSGRVSYRQATDLDVQLDGRNTDVQSVLALLPPRVATRLSAYRSRGDVYFGGTVRGTLAGKDNPRLDFRFGCRDASFYHPEYKQAVEHVFLTGTFSNGPARSARTSELDLREVRGTLQGRPFNGSLRYTDFQDPRVVLNLNADLDVARVLRFYPVAAVREGSGTAQLKVSFAGSMREFRASPATAAVQSAGELTLRGVQVRLRDFTQPFTGLSGVFLLRRNDVAINSFTGRVGASDFQMSGVFRNALGWLLLPRQQLLVEADVKARQLNFDQLLSLRAAAGAATTPTSAGGSYGFRLPPNLALDVNVQAQRARFRRFRGRELRGTIRLQNQVLSAPSLSVAAAGGRASFRGSLDARQPDLLRLSSSTSCQQLPLDSLFYVFEDFGQQFITARHLRGTLTASAESDMYFSSNLDPLTDKLQAEVKMTVRNGELNNFMPLQKLSMIAGRERLRHLRFAQLTTPVYIQSRTVYLPEMEIRSNVKAASLVRVTGTHTFDQQMDYHVSIPILPGLLSKVVSNGSKTGPSLLLAIQGDENNFRVTYDRTRAQVARPPASGSAPTRKPGLLDGLLRPATARPAAATTPAPPTEPRKPFELKKPPEKKPAQPQTGEYFEF
ncbi:AsmA-like C-terminal region-containing protein [uncultured Hymenobacter sp.]|uniref:AsmA-like C-terminal region-containing protein n=1 Tax=uncultured Hymenobacter sp. TaxID=170016 RepID=UPI0035C98228